MQHVPLPPSCAVCGYDLSATPIVRHRITCPECGSHRVRVYRWWEPRPGARWRLLYLALAPLGAAPPWAGAAWMLRLDRADELFGALALVGVPFLALAAWLAAWLPSRSVGTLTITASSLLATAAAVILSVPVSVAPRGLAALTLGAYVLLPVPVAVLMVRSAHR